MLLFVYTIACKRPRQFSKLPYLHFFGLSLLTYCLIFCLSFFPNHLFGSDSPLGAIEAKDAHGHLQWVFNIGSVEGNDTSNGLQIPLYVIIAGILGAYIRYLYVS